MVAKIGAGIALDGEREFKQAISGINKDMAVLASEMGKVTAQFGSNADSMEALTAKQKVYNAQVDEQKKKVEKLKEALANSAEEYGETDKRTKDWKISLNKAEAELAKTENSLKDTTVKMESFGKEADDGGDAVEKAGKKAKSSGDDAIKGASGWDKLGSGLAKTGKLAGRAVLILGSAAGAGMAAALGASLKATAEIEQQLGGAEAVFESNADSIKKWAASSAGSMGMGANAALETANKMGSLFQGSGIAAKESADMTMNMTQRAADVASVMGVDLPMAMEAVTGAAKGNFTMMDNLGVAMNNTTLEAYAQSKGIKTSWKEMTNAEKNGIAYQMFMEKTQKYAGNFAKENTSLAGSFDVLKGSFQNVLSSMADPAMLDASIAQFVSAFKGVAKSVGDVLPKLLSGLMTTFTESIPEIAPVLLDAISGIIPIFIDAVTKQLPNLAKTGLDIILSLISGITQNIQALAQGATSIIKMLVGALLTLLPELLKAGLEVVKELALGIADALPELIPALVETMLAIVDGLIDNIDMLVDAALRITVALAEGLIKALPKLIAKAPQIIGSLVTALVKTIPSIVKVGGDLIVGLWTGIGDKFAWLTEKLSGFTSGVISSIKDFFGVHSPSTVFADIGGNLSTGLANGITGKSGLVSAAMSKINDSLSANANVSLAGAGANTVNYVLGGTVRIEGINNDGQLVASAEFMMEEFMKKLRREGRA